MSIGIAQTGTGKTAAFALPILHRLLDTRMQAAAEDLPRAGAEPDPRTVRPDPRQLQGLWPPPPAERDARHRRRADGPSGPRHHGGVDVLVATPGRLLDLVSSNALRLGQVEFLVLDEADRMLDMGFIHDIRKIVAKLPTERQTLFFSATMPKDIAELAEQMLRDPARVAVTPVASTVERIDAAHHPCRPAAKPNAAGRNPQERDSRSRAGLHPHQARRRQGGARPGQGRHPGRSDPRQQVAEPARARARGLPQRRASARWSRPTSPRAASTSTASAMSSTSTCRTFRRAMSIASAAPRAPAPTASQSRFAMARRTRVPARHRTADPHDAAPGRPSHARRTATVRPASGRRTAAGDSRTTRQCGRGHGPRRQDGARRTQRPAPGSRAARHPGTGNGGHGAPQAPAVQPARNAPRRSGPAAGGDTGWLQGVAFLAPPRAGRKRQPNRTHRPSANARANLERPWPRKS